MYNFAFGFFLLRMEDRIVHSCPFCAGWGKYLMVSIVTVKMRVDLFYPLFYIGIDRYIELLLNMDKSDNNELHSCL